MVDPREIGGVRRAFDAVRKAARAARAYLAGIGTSGSLLAGAALMFIVASSLVAFRGWPHVSAQPSPGEVVVSPSPVSSAASPSARRLQLVSVPPAVGAAGGAVPGAAGLGRPGRGRTGAPARRHSIGRPVSTSIPAGAPAGAGGSLSSPAAPPGAGGSSTVPTLPPGAGGSVTIPTQPVQQAVQQAVQQVASGPGGVVSDTGRHVGSVVQQTTSTSTVAGAVQQASPPVAGVLNGVGSGAANAIGGATQAIAGTLSGTR